MTDTKKRSVLSSPCVAKGGIGGARTFILLSEYLKIGICLHECSHTTRKIVHELGITGRVDTHKLPLLNEQGYHHGTDQVLQVRTFHYASH